MMKRTKCAQSDPMMMKIGLSEKMKGLIRFIIGNSVVTSVNIYNLLHSLVAQRGYFRKLKIQCKSHKDSCQNLKNKGINLLKETLPLKMTMMSKISFQTILIISLYLIIENLLQTTREDLSYNQQVLSLTLEEKNLL